MTKDCSRLRLTSPTNPYFGEQFDLSVTLIGAIPLSGSTNTTSQDLTDANAAAAHT